MNNIAEHLIELRTGEKMTVTFLTYPIDRQDQIQLIDLLQHEWERTDVDWLESMRGLHAETLKTRAVLGWLDGRPVATATVVYPVEEPEVCVVEDVMTLAQYRGRGIGEKLSNMVVDLAFEAGCRVAYLGNTPTSQGSVYLKCGFERISGAIMRRPAPGQETCERDFYAPGQSTSVRQTQWGDLPGLACLMGQPLDCVLLDFRQGLVSSRYAEPVRCVSNFTSVWYDAQSRGGIMLTLAGESSSRVLGFGSLVPGPPPLRNRSALIDVAVHDHYAHGAQRIIDQLKKESRKRHIERLEAWVSESDFHKAAWFTDSGFSHEATLPRQLRLAEKTLAVKVYWGEI